MAKVTLDDLLELSVSERLAIMEGLWDSLTVDPKTLPLTDEQRRELDNRLKEYKTDPQEGRSWARVREELLSELSAPPNHT
jgi:putative addiction module component (TIGR02574 family)